MYNLIFYQPNIFCTLVSIFYFRSMKMTLTKFLEDKDFNRRVLQRTITASLSGDKRAKKKISEKYGITSVEVINSRMYLVNAK